MGRTRQKWDSETERAVRSIDALAEYEEFCEALLPQLRRMILEGWSAEKIRRECAAMVQAQGITKAMRGDLRAIKDVLDRHEGTALKRQAVAHQYASMSKPELVALARQKLLDAGVILRETDPQKKKPL
jgi:hypothetical protein